MRVLGCTQGEYTLLDLTTNEMKQFLFNPMRTDPVDGVREDYLEFFIETILAHQGDPKRLSTTKFRVKWLTYNESHNQWERWKYSIDRYLIQKNLRQIIPKNFKKTTHMCILGDFSFTFSFKFFKEF